MIRKKMTIDELAKTYGCSRSRIYVLLNSQNIRQSSAEKFAKALGCETVDIIEEA
jgi:DNA-binding Xre family transcriptional regulator